MGFPDGEEQSSPPISRSSTMTQMERDAMKVKSLLEAASQEQNSERLYALVAEINRIADRYPPRRFIDLIEPTSCSLPLDAM